MTRWAGFAVTVLLLAGSTPAHGAERPAPIELARCRDHVRAWIVDHPRFFKQADVTWECAWQPFPNSGMYLPDQRHIRINAYGPTKFDVRRHDFYVAVMSHETAHAWGDRLGRYLGRETEWATIRGVTPEMATEDYATVVTEDQGQCISWSAPTIAYINQIPATNRDETSRLRARGFLPPLETRQLLAKRWTCPLLHPGV